MGSGVLHLTSGEPFGALAKRRGRARVPAISSAGRQPLCSTVRITMANARAEAPLTNLSERRTTDQFRIWISERPVVSTRLVLWLHPGPPDRLWAFGTRSSPRAWRSRPRHRKTIEAIAFAPARCGR